ncbi:hypothetical protein LTR36_005529 [Oleoguttula mirabilis]|uniref:G protein-coupled receptor GPR1/2/3 C-terminal domain-containing protein n=1 Tax=Oleoguttula mirabilis TaxID=1507867 RepID=A0AAV9JDY0_9PEZI|nr:hypothetical protein LTR36_005529 [Oleoguttula mirabilis]
MGAPYTPKIQVDGGSYFPAPYSVYPLPPTIRRGLIPVGILAALSVASTICLIAFICYRFVAWRAHYRTFVGNNQYVVLVLNLLLADLQQAASFLISFHWVRKDYILAPHPACFAQGWLLHAGDVGSAFFVLAIAVHTFYTAVYGMRVGTKTFTAGIVGIWVFTYFLTSIGIALHGNKLFVRAGAWCWISSEYESDRLALHYVWLFVVQFGTVLIYFVTFYQLRKKTNQLFAGVQVGHNMPNKATVEAVNRITKLMTLYPCVYVVLTLPLSASRMWSMAHQAAPISDSLACTAAALITSCGWVDSLLYTLTRKALLRDTMPASGNSSAGRRTTGGDDWEATELGSKGITHTRTVTVEGGRVLDAVDDDRHGRQLSDPSGLLRDPSPSGSIDPILYPGRGKSGTTNTEVSVGVPQELLDDSEKSDGVPPLPIWRRQRP